MERVEARTQAQQVLEELYLTDSSKGGHISGINRLAALARTARNSGAALAEHREGPWRSDRCRFAHAAGDERSGETLTCVMRGEFELPFREEDASEVAALLNWADVPEPGAQT